jgi:hypothetical protein
LIGKRSIKMRFLQDLSDPIHQAILSVLSAFAGGDRYSLQKRQGCVTKLQGFR